MLVMLSAFTIELSAGGFKAFNELIFSNGGFEGGFGPNVITPDCGFDLFSDIFVGRVASVDNGLDWLMEGKKSLFIFLDIPLSILFRVMFASCTDSEPSSKDTCLPLVG